MTSTTPLKQIPTFKTDEEAERFVAEADLSEYDLEGRPMSEVFPWYRPKRGRPKIDSPKIAVTLRLDPKTVERFKSSGEDWRARMSAVIEKAAS